LCAAFVEQVHAMSRRMLQRARRSPTIDVRDGAMIGERGQMELVGDSTLFSSFQNCSSSAPGRNRAVFASTNLCGTLRATVGDERTSATDDLGHDGFVRHGVPLVKVGVSVSNVAFQPSKMSSATRLNFVGSSHHRRVTNAEKTVVRRRPPAICDAAVGCCGQQSGLPPTPSCWPRVLESSIIADSMEAVNSEVIVRQSDCERTRTALRATIDRPDRKWVLCIVTPVHYRLFYSRARQLFAHPSDTSSSSANLCYPVSK